jgi:DNA invertase Pin-like site-specific DNA recombinase
MKTMGYARVSTSEQAREDVSLAMQAKKIDAYAMTKDWPLAELIRDDGYSAKSLGAPVSSGYWPWWRRERSAPPSSTNVTG